MKGFAVVTGGTKGIGKGVVEMLLRDGYEVTATYAHDEECAMGCLQEWKAISGSFEILRCDQARPEDVRSFTQAVKARHGHVDCLVLNAGTTLRKGLAQITNHEWEEVMQVNVNSNLYMVRDLYGCLAAVPGRHSSVVMIGSLMAIHPHATSLAYGVTKGALHALARNLVKCFEGKDVSVNAIAPGFVETGWQREKPAEIRSSICAKTAIGRFASVGEIADAVRFCINNPYVNGSVLEISGGYSFK